MKGSVLRRLKWFLSVTSAILSSLFVVVLESRF